MSAFLARFALIFTAFFWLCGQCAAAMPAKALLLVNMNNGRILYAHNADLAIAPASLAKIMTSCLTMDAIKNKKLGLNQNIRISARAARIGGSAMGLNAGDKVPVVRLLSGMAVSSGNDAATALAIQIGGNEKNFVAMMNRKARQLGMKNTVFKNPTGLPAAGQKTTARDMMRLVLYYLKTYPEAWRFHKMKYFLHKGVAARNTNPLLGVVNGVNGLKTGWTVASGYNLVATATRGKTSIMAIALGCASKQARDAITRKMIETGFHYPDNPARAKKEILGR